MSEWWLSFVGPKGNLGVCIVSGTSFLNAVQEAHRLGINPGGEVAGKEILSAMREGMAKYPKGVLLSPAELEKIGGVKKIKEMTPEERRLFENDLRCAHDQISDN